MVSQKKQGSKHGLQHDTTFIKFFCFLKGHRVINYQWLFWVARIIGLFLCASLSYPHFLHWAYIYFVITKIIFKLSSYSTIPLFTARLSLSPTYILSSYPSSHGASCPQSQSLQSPATVARVAYNSSMTLPGSKTWSIMTAFHNTTCGSLWSAGSSLTVGLVSLSALVLSSWWVPAPVLPVFISLPLKASSSRLSFLKSINLFFDCAVFVAMHKLSLVAGLVVVEHGLNFSVACGIFLDQGFNLCLLHWQVRS